MNPSYNSYEPTYEDQYELETFKYEQREREQENEDWLYLMAVED